VDRVIPKKRFTTKRLLTIGGIIALIALISASYYFTSGKSKLSVELERLTVSTITKGPFQVTIPVNGQVMPLTTIYMTATEGGTVEERYVEDGAMMKKGEPILKLANTDLELQLATQQTAVYQLYSAVQLANVTAQAGTVLKQTNLADAEGLYKEAERTYILDKKLYAQKAIGSQEFQSAENNYNYLKRKRDLTATILQQDSLTVKQQLEQTRQAFVGGQNTLKILQKKVGDLVLRAPVDGRLTSLDAEVGESRVIGAPIGQIDVVSGFKVQVPVDQTYLPQVYPGLLGTFSYNGKTYTLSIKKIYSQVTTGHFNIDMVFVGEEPKGIRRGQDLPILLALTDETVAVLVPRGGFYQKTGGNWIFKVSDDGKTAYKADIQLGRQNPEFYEVLSGLKPGDKVVTSSYDNYGDMQELVFKK
jgi:HlyD family secretion protein